MTLHSRELFGKLLLLSSILSKKKVIWFYLIIDEEIKFTIDRGALQLNYHHFKATKEAT